MRDLIVQWLTQITAPFWKSSLSIDQFITALQETFHMVFFCNAVWLYLGLYSSYHFIGHTS